MKIDLENSSETGSFLLPAYAFVHGEIPNLPRLVPLGPAAGIENMYAPFPEEAPQYLPLASDRFLFGTGILYNDGFMKHRGPIQLKLQMVPSEKPGSASSCCLMIGGRRLTPRRGPDNRIDLIPSFAIWQDQHGREVTPITQSAFPIKDRGRTATKTISAHWNGQGVLCAEGSDGLTDLLLIDFQIFDDRQDMADILRVHAAWHRLPWGGLPTNDPSGAPLNDHWSELILRSFHHFAEECGP